jgi:hypothetical protein
LHGVPATLDLSGFLGAQLQRIDLGKWIIHFHFDMNPAGVIGVEGEWELTSSEGTVLDRQQEPDERDAYRLHHLLLREVVGVSVNAPDSFTLTFDNGLALTIFDLSKEYESFSIQPGDIYA